MEVAQRSANAVQARIKAADFPVLKDLDTYDFAAMPSLGKQKVLELSRGEWIEQHCNEWGQIFQGERMTAALLDRFTHRCDIFEVIPARGGFEPPPGYERVRARNRKC